MSGIIVTKQRVREVINSLKPALEEEEARNARVIEKAREVEDTKTYYTNLCEGWLANEENLVKKRTLKNLFMKKVVDEYKTVLALEAYLREDVDTPVERFLPWSLPQGFTWFMFDVYGQTIYSAIETGTIVNTVSNLVKELQSLVDKVNIDEQILIDDEKLLKYF